MTVRLHGRRVAPDAASLAEAFPAASGRLVVFLHGLGDTERAWFGRGFAASGDFGTRLQADFGFTPIYLRYNSGRRIGANGRELLDLLSELIDHWPTRVVQVLLVGHSMGGLVARSALDQANHEPRRRCRLPRQTWLVCLGTPHSGVAFERAVTRAAAVLVKSTIGAPLAWVLGLRSEGIKDLGYGTLLPAGLSKPSARRSAYKRPPGPALFVVATVSRNKDSLFARLIGDLLVAPASAGATTLNADLQWLGGLHHRDLSRHERVYQVIRQWLDGMTRRRLRYSPV